MDLSKPVPQTDNVESNTPLLLVQDTAEEDKVKLTPKEDEKSTEDGTKDIISENSASTTEVKDSAKVSVEEDRTAMGSVETPLEVGEKRENLVESTEILAKMDGKESEIIESKELETNAADVSDIEAKQVQLDTSKQVEINPEKMEIDLKQAEIEPKPMEIESKQPEIDAKQAENAEIEPKQAAIDSKQTEIDPKQAEIDPKQTEIDPKQAEIDPKPAENNPKQDEINPKQDEINPKQAEIDPKQTEIDPKQAESSIKPCETVTNQDETNKIPEEMDPDPDHLETMEDEIDLLPTDSDIPQPSVKVTENMNKTTKDPDLESKSDLDNKQEVDEKQQSEQQICNQEMIQPTSETNLDQLANVEEESKCTEEQIENNAMQSDSKTESTEINVEPPQNNEEQQVSLVEQPQDILNLVEQPQDISKQTSEDLILSEGSMEEKNNQNAQLTVSKDGTNQFTEEEAKNTSVQNIPGQDFQKDSEEPKYSLESFKTAVEQFKTKSVNENVLNESMDSCLSTTVTLDTTASSTTVTLDTTASSTTVTLDVTSDNADMEELNAIAEESLATDMKEGTRSNNSTPPASVATETDTIDTPVATDNQTDVIAMETEVTNAMETDIIAMETDAIAMETDANDVTTVLGSNVQKAIPKGVVLLDINDDSSMEGLANPIPTSSAKHLDMANVLSSAANQSMPTRSESSVSLTSSLAICEDSNMSINSEVSNAENGKEGESSKDVSKKKTPVNRRRQDLTLELLTGGHQEDGLTAEHLFEYRWPEEIRADWYMIQEQVSEFLGVKSFKRKYPDLERRNIDPRERVFLREKGVVTEMQADLGLTAVRADLIHDLMQKDYPQKYKEYLMVLKERKKKQALEKHKEQLAQRGDKNRMEQLRQKAIKSVMSFNAMLNRERRDERKAYFDVHTFEVQYPRNPRKILPPEATKVGSYPVALIPGQYQDYHKKYTPQEMKYLPLNTALYNSPRKQNNIYADPEPGSEGEEVSSESSEQEQSSEADSDAESVEIASDMFEDEEEEGEGDEDSQTEGGKSKVEKKMEIDRKVQEILDKLNYKESRKGKRGRPPLAEIAKYITTPKKLREEAWAAEKAAASTVSAAESDNSQQSISQTASTSSPAQSQAGESKKGRTPRRSKKIVAKRLGGYGLKEVPLCNICGGTQDNNAMKQAEEFVQCSECHRYGHPSCLELTSEMISIIKTYPWQCMECKTCVKCKDSQHEDKMLFCDHCDRGYHTFCVGLEAIPNGRWECPSCRPAVPENSQPMIAQTSETTQQLPSPVPPVLPAVLPIN